MSSLSGGKEGPEEGHNENGCGIVPSSTPSASSGKVNWIYLLICSGLVVGNPGKSLGISLSLLQLLLNTLEP